MSLDSSGSTRFHYNKSWTDTAGRQKYVIAFQGGSDPDLKTTGLTRRIDFSGCSFGGVCRIGHSRILQALISSLLGKFQSFLACKANQDESLQT